MLSNHYPLSFGTANAWIIACLVFLIGVTIRHYFNSMHARKGRPSWTWAATVILFIAIAWLSSTPGFDGDVDEAEAVPLTRYEMRFAEAEGFDQAHEIVQGRCAMCHARAPVWEGMRWAPKGVLLETPRRCGAQCAGDLSCKRGSAMPCRRPISPIYRKRIARF